MKFYSEISNRGGVALTIFFSTLLNTGQTYHFKEPKFPENVWNQNFLVTFTLTNCVQPNIAR